MVADARRYTTLVGDEEILTEIQHFGGVTNLTLSGHARNKPDDTLG